MLKNIHHYCQGYSHLASDKPCQDCAYSESWGDCAMAIVSDGHGGDRYFRSDRGSKFLVDVTARALKEFAKVMSKDPLLSSESQNGINPSREQKAVGTPLSPGVYVFPTNNPDRLDKRLHQKMQWLFSSIKASWIALIDKDASENTLTDWEKEHVDSKYQEAFLKGERLEKNYGSTLMAYLQTPMFWMAFQIGDGKLVTLRITEGNARFSQPVPWDDNCFLNKTTSICDSDALSEFRYCFCFRKKFPDAVFLGSDGIDDTFGDGDRLNSFYQNLYNELTTDGIEETKKDLVEELPIISQRGSKDDMSVACVFDDARMKENRTVLLGYKVGKFSDEMTELKEKIAKIKAKINQLKALVEPTEAQRIELQYALNDWNKLETRRKQLIGLKGQVNKQHLDSKDPKANKKSSTQKSSKSKGSKNKKK